MKRVGEAQIWPAIRILAAAAMRPTLAPSTPSPISTGAWPPSSSRAGFIAAPASCASCLPTCTEPVRVIMRITGEAISVAEIFAGSPNTRFSTPGGRPASAKHCTKAQAVPGVSSAAFRITEQPAASAALTLRAGELSGTFQGVNAATGPTGWRSTMRCCCGPEGITVP